MNVKYDQLVSIRKNVTHEDTRLHGSRIENWSVDEIFLDRNSFLSCFFSWKSLIWYQSEWFSFDIRLQIHPDSIPECHFIIERVWRLERRWTSILAVIGRHATRVYFHKVYKKFIQICVIIVNHHQNNFDVFFYFEIEHTQSILLIYS